MRAGGSCEKEDERSAEDEGVHVKLMDALVPVASKLSMATGEHKKEGKRRKEGQLGTRGEGREGKDELLTDESSLEDVASGHD